MCLHAHALSSLFEWIQLCFDRLIMNQTKMGIPKIVDYIWICSEKNLSIHNLKRANPFRIISILKVSWLAFIQRDLFFFVLKSHVWMKHDFHKEKLFFSKFVWITIPIMAFIKRFSETKGISTKEYLFEKFWTNIYYTESDLSKVPRTNHQTQAKNKVTNSQQIMRLNAMDAQISRSGFLYIYFCSTLCQ